MKTPFLLLGASLVFWGWQTGLLLIAVPLAIAAEGAYLVRSRVEISSADFNRISDLCTLIFIGMFAYLFLSHRSGRMILLLFQWLPMVFSPLLLAQIYSTKERIALSALFLLKRKGRAENEDQNAPAINLTFPFFGLCLLSASVANQRTPWFYLGLFGLASWALWSSRSRRFSSLVWGLLLLFAGIGGYFGQMGLHHLHGLLERKATDWFTSFLRSESDPFRARTAIGELGTLKLSDQILFRVSAGQPTLQPILLREAAYNVYLSSTWFAMRADFKPLRPHGDGSAWKLRAAPNEGNSLTVSTPLRKGKGMLKLPSGAFEISNLPVPGLMGNRFAAIKVDEGPGLVNYRVRFEPSISFDDPPNETDLSIPESERPALSAIVRKLNLQGRSFEEVQRRLTDFFEGHFTYSLTSAARGSRTTPLQEFLIRTRSGHCEYFASAAVLLLRVAGIPARYATGYSVNEFSRLENRFVVRSRHAHAWALVWSNGAWQDFDPTPSSWAAEEQKGASFLEPIFDLWAWCAFKITEWRWMESSGPRAKHMIWLLIPLILLLLKRIWARGRTKSIKTQQERNGMKALKPGVDSPFYLIEKKLTDAGYVRRPGETLWEWIRRIDRVNPLISSLPNLPALLGLHYRYRFDPRGIMDHEKEELKAKVQAWLEMYTLSHKR